MMKCSDEAVIESKATCAFGVIKLPFFDVGMEHTIQFVSLKTDHGAPKGVTLPMGSHRQWGSSGGNFSLLRCLSLIRNRVK